MAIPLTARQPIEFTPPALKERNTAENQARVSRGESEQPDVKIVARVPTMYERDSFAAALVRGGVVQYGPKQIRDMMIAGVAHLKLEEEFDELVDQLQQLWAWGDAQRECQERRDHRLVELLEQQAALPDSQKLTDEQIEEQINDIKPGVELPETLRVRITAVQQDIMSRYQPLQMAFADVAEQDTKRRWICIETYVTTWKGLAYTPDGNGRGGLTRPEAEWLRTQIGGDAFDQLGDFIFAMHTIDGDEEKNLASLIENFSVLTGSGQPESTSAPVTGHGTSTDEPSTSTPDTASARTTESSSGSGMNSETKTDASASSPTPEG